MTFWDASAIVPLLIVERRSQSLQSLARSGATMVVWWATKTECVSALARFEREGSLDPHTIVAALNRLNELAANWQEVEPSEPVREAAARFLRVHPLRAAD